MKPSEALDLARTAFVQDRLTISTHARGRMRERGVQLGDIEKVLWTHSVPTYDPPGEKWIITGRDLDGDELSVVVSFDSDRPRVVTVLEKEDC